jgi:hypothetical protein
MILHSNDSVRMLRHHVLTVIGKVLINVVEGQNCSAAVVCLEDDEKNLRHGACYWVTVDQSHSSRITCVLGRCCNYTMPGLQIKTLEYTVYVMSEGSPRLMISSS